MLGGINTSALSQLYRSQTSQYSGLIEQIASGKTINKPSDDFVGYTRATAIQSDISAYKDINVDLTGLKEAAQMASDVGNGIYEDLGRMKELVELYGATSDTDEQAAYQTEFDSLSAGITDTIANSYYGTEQLMVAGDLGPEIDLNPDTSAAQTFTLTYGSGDVVSTASLDITSSSAADVQTQMERAASFAVKSEGYMSRIDRQIEVNENLITSKENTSSALTDIDEVKALAQATELQVRQQATTSMIAQANLMAGSVARLYQ